MGTWIIWLVALLGMALMMWAVVRDYQKTGVSRSVFDFDTLGGFMASGGICLIVIAPIIWVFATALSTKKPTHVPSKVKR